MRALCSKEQHTGLALDLVSKKQLAGHDCARQINCREGFRGTPLSAQQSVPLSGKKTFDQPRDQRTVVDLAVFEKLGQSCLLRLVLIEIGIVVELFVEILELIIRQPCVIFRRRWQRRWRRLNRLRLRCWCGFRLLAATVRPPTLVRERQLLGAVFACTPRDLAAQPALAQIATADPAGELLQVFKNLFLIPANAEIVANDCVKKLTAVFFWRISFTYEP